ncbi:cytochrome P450 [Stachybotrys elegans]|uniref:Cytochrome P450 n=1 Tax=Stachybotrys elegans TaxID=80388 RepID=A0A8K0SDW6_9HYPO|nr:cytochrome P450 [Stachybotrys elegans]
MAVLCSTGGALALACVGITLYMAYRAMLPKPIPGIPYNKDAAGKLLGDIPEMMGYVMRTKRIFCWLTSLNARHQSPIIQAFVKPGGLPWVVVTDPFESQDILLRRIKELDRSEFFGEVIGGILPEQHIQFVSTDDRFKNNRNLINHLMAPTFIKEVSAPELYMSVCTLIKLWKIKCGLAKGRPFSAHHDVTFAVLDSIFASMFGLNEADTNTIQRITAVENFEPVIPEHVNEPVSFPEGSTPDIFSAVLTLANSVTDTQLSPAPVFTSWLIRKFPYMRNAKAVKDKYIRDKVEECVQLIEDGLTTKPKSALHSVLIRECQVAAKEGRQPDYHKRAIADEFFGFMTAGHDTSATTIAWGLKMLTDNPNAQTRLRQELRAAFPAAVSEKRDLTYAELSSSSIPYLDAVVDEILRHANTIAFVARQAQQDTVILGHHIPKGTNVFLMANGPGYLEPAIDLNDEERSPGARQGGKSALTGAWSNDDIRLFKPERWLEKDATGVEIYNGMAGPSLAFGMGLRGCYGKRLAIQVLKIQFSLLLWHFELLSVPDKLGGYEAVQKFAREPTQCYIRLKEVE